MVLLEIDFEVGMPIGIESQIESNLYHLTALTTFTALSLSPELFLLFEEKNTRNWSLLRIQLAWEHTCINIKDICNLCPF